VHKNILHILRQYVGLILPLFVVVVILVVVGLERGPLSLVSITEELLDGKVAAPV
jgi:hypothetical protein